MLCEDRSGFQGKNDRLSENSRHEKESMRSRQGAGLGRLYFGFSLSFSGLGFSASCLGFSASGLGFSASGLGLPLSSILGLPVSPFFPVSFFVSPLQPVKIT